MANPQYKKPEPENIVAPLGLDVDPPTFLTDIFGTFPTVSAIPTKAPFSIKDQIQFYVSGGTMRIYIYDAKNAV